MEKTIENFIKKTKNAVFSTNVYSCVSVSAYDTAWLARVPHPEHPSDPMFPPCLDWILNNQKELGFWGETYECNLPTMDSLTSTLACMVALKTWGVGLECIEKGVTFIHENTDKMLREVGGSIPRWFAIVFPAMLEHGWSQGLKLFPQGSTEPVKSIFTQRKWIFDREETFEQACCTPLIHYLEALPHTYLLDCEEVLVRHQNKDGSLFQSPSATASAFMITKNKACQDYLEYIVKRCGHGVPPMYPMDEDLIQLSIVDELERLGLEGYFEKEIKDVLSNAYRNWMDQDLEPIEKYHYIPTVEIYKASIAYRILTMHGYRVSSSRFCWFMDHGDMVSHIEKNHEHFMSTMLNVYRASELGKEEVTNAKSFSKKILEKGVSRHKFSDGVVLASRLHSEIEHELSIPWLVRMDHLEHRDYIERGNTTQLWLGKASYYSLSCLNNTLLLDLAKENYTYRQSLFKNELEELMRWSRDTGISDVRFGRHKTSYCYFCVASTSYHPRLREVRLAGAKNGVLLTIIDDFFDIHGSIDELTTFTEAVERWDGEGIRGHGKVLFDALDDLVNGIARQALPIQRRDVTRHLREIWCRIVRSWLKEREWSERSFAPSVEEYLALATISVAVETVVLPALYLVGPTLSVDQIDHPDYKKIMELLMITTRLLNDSKSYEKEREEGKPNLILLLEGNSNEKIGEASKYIASLLDETEKELVEHVLMDDKNSVPRPCRQLHLTMHKIYRMLYNSTNKYDSPTELIDSITKAIYEPLSV